MPSSRHVAIACGVLLCVAVGRSQTPASISWFGMTDSDFTKSSNWSGGPLTNDTFSTLVTFATTAAPQPVLNTNFSVAGIQYSVLAGSFTLSGTGLLTLGANGIENQNTFFAQTISAPLSVSTDLSFTNQGTLLISGSVSNAAPSALTLDGLGTGGTISGVISGTGGLVKNGTGSWTLANANTFTGATTINLGTLVLADADALQGSVVNFVGGNLSFGALTAATFGGLSGSQNLALSNPSSGSVNLTLANTSDTTYRGSISGGGALIKTGIGAFRVTGPNSYSGGTMVNGGNFVVTGNGTLSPTGLVTVNSTGASTASFTVDPNLSLTIGSLTIGGAGAAANAQNYVTIGANSTISVGGRVTYDATNNPAGASIQGGTLAFGSSSAFFDVGRSTNSGTADLTISSTITTTDGFVKIGAGNLVLSGANTLNVGTLVQEGTLTDGSSGAFSPNGLFAVAPGASLFVNHNETIAGLDDFSGASGNVTVAEGVVLTINNPGHNTFSGSLSGGGQLEIAGNGRQVIAGADTLAGVTIIDIGGALQIGAGGTTGSVSGMIVDNGSLSFNRSDAITYGNIAGSGYIMHLGSGTLLLGGSNSYLGPTYVSGGTLTDAGPGSFSSSSHVEMNGGTLNVQFNESIGGLGDFSMTEAIIPGVVTIAGDTTLKLTSGGDTFSGMVNGAGALEIAPGTNQTFIGNVSHTGGTTIDNGGSLSIGNGHMTGAVSGSIIDNGALYFDRADSITYGGIAGTGFVNHLGSGTLALTGANAFSGGMFVNSGILTDATPNAFSPNSTISLRGGTIDVQFNESIGGLGDFVFGDVNIPGAVTLSGDTTLKITRGGGNNFSGTISGAGAIEIASLGYQQFIGDATYTGGTTIDQGGWLIIGNGGSTGSLAGSVVDNGTLKFNRSDAISLGNISGTGSVRQSGAGTLTLTGTNTYSGQTIVSSGTLSDSGPGTLSPSSQVQLQGTGAQLNIGSNETIRGLGGDSLSIGTTVTIASGAVLSLNGSSQIYSGTITGAGGLTNLSGTQMLGGTNNYSGLTTIVSGSIYVTSDTALPTAMPLTFNPGANQFASLTFPSRTVTVGALTIKSSAPGGTVSMWGSNLNLAGDLTYDATNSPGPASMSLNSLTWSGARTFTIGDTPGLDHELTIFGNITGSGNSLLKAGPGTLQLTASNSTFDGGVTVSGGTLRLGSPNAAGTGTITVCGGGALSLPSPYSGTAYDPMSSSSSNFSIGNPVSLANNAVLGEDADYQIQLTLTGPTTLQSSSSTVHLGKGTIVQLGGSVSGPAGSTLTFDNGGRVILSGATDATISNIIASGAGVFFVSAASVPTTLSIGANGGYVGVAATNPGKISAPVTPSAVLDRITDKANFNGTFGFDTDPSSKLPTFDFNQPVDFSGFTGSNFTIGSSSSAILAGLITPPPAGYTFGNGGGGVLAVQSNLTAAKPVSVVSSSLQNGLAVILRGNNRYPSLTVGNSAVILDSARAFTGTGSVTLQGTGAYLGATEAFQSAPGFLSFVASQVGSNYNSGSILGFDSHRFIEEAIASNSKQATRVVSDAIDLSGFDSLYLGTFTGATFAGSITAPASGTLSLVNLGDGRLTIQSALVAGNVRSLVIGDEAIGHDGQVELDGANTFGGGTTVKSGHVIIGNSTAFGTGGIVVDAGTTSGNHPSFESNAPSGINVSNPIALATDLEIGRWYKSDLSDYPDFVKAAGNQLTLSGDISGSGGLRVVNGTVVVSGSNSYSGATDVVNGALIFGAAGSIPASSLLRPESQGYIGIGYDPGDALQSAFINRIDKPGMSGTIGFDSPNGGQLTYGANVDLSAFGPSARLGSATTARLTGTITPASGTTTYLFGGGGGVLDVASALTDNGTNPMNVNLSSAGGPPLTLRLSSTANTYTGPTQASGGAIVFAANALPSSATLFSLMNNGYLGTEDTSSAGAAAFLARLSSYLPSGTIGFDAAPGQSNYPVASNLDLSRFVGGGVLYVGSTTDVVFGSSASITLPSTASAFAFSPYKSGVVEVDFNLADQPLGATGLRLGNPAAYLSPTSEIILAGANSYTGGTQIASGANVVLANSTALSPGSPVTIVPSSDPYNGRATLSTSLTSGLSMANAINLQADLEILGANNLTLGGIISGGSDPQGHLLQLHKSGSGVLTLSGHNTFAGGISIAEGAVILQQNDSLGSGPLEFDSDGSASPSATFNASSIVNGIFGDRSGGHIVIGGTGNTLTVNQTFDSQFAGSITSSAGSIIYQGTPASGASNVKLTVSGSNNYNGATRIDPGIVVVAGNNNAFGPVGPANAVTINGGKLAVGSGVVVANPITLLSGKIGGFGTFQAPAGSTGYNIASGTILAPGIGGPGNLTFDGSLISTSVLILNSGGTYNWQLMDAANPNGGWDTITVNGSVNIAAGGTPFTFNVISVSADGTNGLAGNFDPTQSYNWPVLTANSIIGYTGSTQFNVVPTGFTNSYAGTFSLNVTGSSLVLNFSPIPEPSSYALMVAGLAAAGFAGVRCRRQRRR